MSFTVSYPFPRCQQVHRWKQIFEPKLHAYELLLRDQLLLQRKIRRVSHSLRTAVSSRACIVWTLADVTRMRRISTDWLLLLPFHLHRLIYLPGLCSMLFFTPLLHVLHIKSRQVHSTSFERHDKLASILQPSDYSTLSTLPTAIRYTALELPNNFEDWKRIPTTAAVLFGMELPYNPPKSPVGAFIWWRRMLVETTIGLSALEPWERS